MESIGILAGFRRAKQRDYDRGRHRGKCKHTNYASETLYQLVFDPGRARAEDGQAHRPHYQFHYFHATPSVVY
jgi:hypothetical protein